MSCDWLPNSSNAATHAFVNLGSECAAFEFSLISFLLIHSLFLLSIIFRQPVNRGRTIEPERTSGCHGLARGTGGRSIEMRGRIGSGEECAFAHFSILLELLP